MKKLMFLVITLALFLGAVSACEDVPTPTPQPTISAPGAYLASMTSAQFAGQITNETGTSAVVFSNEPTLNRPTVNTATLVASAMSGTFTGSPTFPTTLAEIGVAATGKIYLDGGSNTYISESAADRMTLTIGGIALLELLESGGGANDSLILPVATRLYFDGGGDTYISQVSPNRIELVAGGTQTLLLDTTTATFHANANVLVGTATYTTGASKVLAFGDTTAPTSGMAGSPVIYATGGLLYSMTNAGKINSLNFTRGITSIPVGDVTASVTHTLGTTPTVVQISWTGTTEPAAVAASTVYLRSSVYDSTTFTLNITGGLSNRPSITWIAIP